MFRRGGATTLLCSLLLTFLIFGCVKGASYGDVRLISLDQSKKFPPAGRLEVYTYNNFNWGTVCNQDSSFNQIAADIVCKQLGYSVAQQYGSVSEMGFFEGSGEPAMSSVNCSSRTLSKLTNCRFSYSASCSHYYDVAVRCRNTGDDIRLMTWSGRLNNISAGRLEVYKNYEWGTICRHGFTADEAKVACKQLGFSDYSAYGTTYSFNLPSASDNVQYFLSGLSCSSTESSLFECPRYSDRHYSCSHDSDDTALSCIGTGALRLVDSTTFDQSLPSSGRLEIYLNGQWGTIDYDGVGYSEATIACKQLGFSGALEYGSVLSLGYTEAYSSTPMWLSDLSCNYYEDTILDCSSTLGDSSIYYHYHGADLALRCDSPGSTTWMYPSDAGASLGAILGITMGSLFVCSFMLILTSLICVSVACARVNKRRSRRCVQRNVIEEPSHSGYTSCPGYPSSFSSPRPPPPPYSAIDVHVEERARQPTPNLGQQHASLQPVVNFPENYVIEHEVVYPTTSAQPESVDVTHAATNHATFSSPDMTGRNDGSEEENKSLTAEGSSCSVSEDQPLICNSD